jgi:PEP-CTERM motif
MKTQVIRKGFSPTSEIPKFDTTRKTMKNLRPSIFATALCCLAMVVGGAVLPCAAESVTSGTIGGAATGPVVVANGGGFGDWAGSPESNPNQITVTANALPSGAFYANLNFESDGNPLREYGMTWNMTNNSGLNWYSMHFTIEYAPLEDFSVTFDAGETGLQAPHSSVYGLDNWSDTNIDFSGGPVSGSGGTASFFLPLDVNGKCCSGNFIVFATPDYAPSTPEPSSLMLFGSGILGVGGLLRRRFLG